MTVTNTSTELAPVTWKEAAANILIPEPAAKLISAKYPDWLPDTQRAKDYEYRVRNGDPSDPHTLNTTAKWGFRGLKTVMSGISFLLFLKMCGVASLAALAFVPIPVIGPAISGMILMAPLVILLIALSKKYLYKTPTQIDPMDEAIKRDTQEIIKQSLEEIDDPNEIDFFAANDG